MLSQTTEYALRAVVHLAKNPEQPQTAIDIADATRVSPGYLSKVMQSLVRGKIVRSQRGLHGGFRLSRDPSEIPVLEVINCVGPIPRITRCPLGIPGHGEKLCSLHRRLDDAMLAIERSFGTTTLAELVEQSDDSFPLCEHIQP
ncbi:MAG: Rrf2 family transcriptional regulator [Myxococcales bacterium]|nr:Rrf2 family transcriptional regulator [Myxococcales bacterium]